MFCNCLAQSLLKECLASIQGRAFCLVVEMVTSKPQYLYLNLLNAWLYIKALLGSIRFLGRINNQLMQLSFTIVYHRHLQPRHQESMSLWLAIILACHLKTETRVIFETKRSLYKHKNPLGCAFFVSGHTHL